MPQTIQVSDKLMHGISYALLSCTLMAGLVANHSSRITHYLLACICATLYGALMEVLQRFCTLSRSGEMADLLADIIGTVIGVIIIALWRTLSTTSH